MIVKLSMLSNYLEYQFFDQKLEKSWRKLNRKLGLYLLQNKISETLVKRKNMC